VAEMLSFALDFDSRHWAEKAVTWIEAGFPIDAPTCDKLLKIAASKIDSQDLRHRSQKQANRWQLIDQDDSVAVCISNPEGNI
jgi:hypothetical protein